MGLFDKARELAEQHADKVEQAIDKVADVVDDKTGGKYADQIEKGAEAAKGLVDGDDGDGEHVTVDGDPSGPPTPPAV